MKTCFFTYTQTEIYHFDVDITEEEEAELRMDPDQAMNIWLRHHDDDYDKSDDLIQDYEEASEVMIEEEEL